MPVFLYIDPESVHASGHTIQIVLISMLGGARYDYGTGHRRSDPDSDCRVDPHLLGHRGTGVDMLIYGFLIYPHFGLSTQGIWGLFANIGKKKMDKSTCLEVKGLSKWFGGLAANLDIDFPVEEGDRQCNRTERCGKIDALNCITGFYKPNSGKVSFFGKDITKFRADKVCNLGIARTFQIVQVISDMTVLENV